MKGKMGTWHDYLRYCHRFGKGARPSPGLEPHQHSNVRLISFLKTLHKEELKGHVRSLIDNEEQMLSVVKQQRVSGELYFLGLILIFPHPVLLLVTTIHRETNQKMRDQKCQ
jgi:hypothetical protein